MIVNIEFLGIEPIENVITALNYKIDKTVFYGYEEIIKQHRSKTDKFLKNYCGVKEVEYISVSHTDMESIVKVIRERYNSERKLGNDVFFDITGGESLILVAFGKVSSECDVPMHMYDIAKNKMIEYKSGAGKISQVASRQHINMNLDRYIEMCGGIVNHHMHKDLKGITDDNFIKRTEAMWKVMAGHASCWNGFCNILKRCFKPDDSYHATCPANHVERCFGDCELSDDSEKTFKNLLDELEKCEVLNNVKCDGKSYSFTYNGAEMKNCLWDSGSVLELHTYRKYKEISDDCRIGVHIDWDGIINEIPGTDILNEIDVLALNSYIPTFISCKSGKMGNEKSLHALYELETVAARFGRKYAKKILVLTEPLSKTYKMRADEMGIEIQVLS